MVRDGCAFGRESRVMISSINKNLEDLKAEQTDNFSKIDARLTDLFNHQSSRLPMWVTIIFTIGGSLLTGLIIWALTN